MKLNKVMMIVVLLGSIGVFVTGLKNGTQEAQAATQEAPVQGAPAVLFPDYEIGLFSHKAHVTGAALQCTACHNGIFEMSASTAKGNDDFNKISFGEGKYCGACHNGSVAFGVQDEASCSRCHGNDVTSPDTILLEKPLKAILFNHALHNKELGLACNECHMKLFDMKTGSTGEEADFTMEAMYNGKYCGACHNGTMAFDLKADCTKCHVDTPEYKRATSGAGKKEKVEQ
ncbi:c(7)-type cytochrome triheme domain-containing protein [Candidatus Electrothrix marina]|uniref:C(7)-type cytochrome triheme domain-containing protein n=1 Tax=Candidatus Electrothrix marina TaxID=1859130 RepID=A0A444JDL6_9BACT|nr:c(7)-type cytochrome triheme domain-containing protein [Candidatus Electrothrix marina]